MTWVRMGDRRRDRTAVDERAQRAASGLQALGVGPGDVVAVYLRNDFPFLEATLAAGMVGAYTVPVNWHGTVDEARHVLEDSGARVVVIHADLLRRVGAAIPAGAAVVAVATPPELRAAYAVPDADAAVPPGVEDWEGFLARHPPKPPPHAVSPGSMIYTSGTTGRPKGVRRRPPTPEQTEALQRSFGVLFALDAWRDRMAEVVLLIPGPAYHSSPNAWMFNFYSQGANLVVEPRFDAETLLRRVEEERVTHMLAVPTMFVRLLRLPEAARRRHDLSSLVDVMHVGSPCPPAVKRAMIDWWGPVVTEHFGSTEVGAVTYCSSAEWLAHPGTVGRPMAGCTVRVLDEEGRPLPAGQAGEVACLRHDYPAFTYHGDDGKRRRAARGDLVATGDVGYFDADGFLYLCGRASDMIIFGGSNVYPAEIEAELLKLPGIADCAVFGIPDDEYGEQVCAVVQPLPGVGLSSEAIRSALGERLASYKVPRRIELAESLPREDTGKIFKRKLRDPYWQAAGRSI